jgi:hypothetical protein
MRNWLTAPVPVPTPGPRFYAVLLALASVLAIVAFFVVPASLGVSILIALIATGFFRGAVFVWSLNREEQ